jgi:magnesium-protoporphyrin O-methyltransferase
VQKHLLAGIGQERVPGSTVLDIGCGVGSLHLTLLQRGASRAVGIDISEGMLKEAKRFAEQMGLNDRTEYINGDFTTVSANVPESDITLLDKVVCCYENLDTLVRLSTAKTMSMYALTHPKENMLMRCLFKSHRALARIFGWSFHPFWHDWAKMKALILAQGFRLVDNRSTLAWQVLVFQRL